ncbi:hypothetical protein [Egibacter rhizosphaerae]|uniref:hypothetical protein n=1 Tax=Egibacter rhizosphaerae TaxID=1670831 RepID=UPI0013F17A8D|nr:hypothetical protein [Egibacter rhizosphaerae]
MEATGGMQAQGVWGPLAALLPPESLADWSWTGTVTAPDTGAPVEGYRHAVSGAELWLDTGGRVYEVDGRGGAARFGDGGAAALLAALLRAHAAEGVALPRRVELPESPAPCVEDLPRLAGALARVEADLWRASEAARAGS